VKYIVLCVIALAACDGCNGEKYTVAELQNPETCKECHPKHYDQWSGSMHAYAAEDPVFVAMNKRGQRDTNGELGDFCVSCHAPMAVRLGIQNGANFDPTTLPPEAKGVTCYFCHNVEQVTDDHNAPIVLANDQTMRGGARNPVDNPAHHSKFDAALMAGETNKSTICGSCHDLVTPAGVHLERTFAEWKTTIFPIEDPDPAAALPQTCSRCHMFPEDGVIASSATIDLDVKSRSDGLHDHTLPGVDLALTPFPQMAEQLAAVKGDLLAAVAIVGPRPLGSREAPGGICLEPEDGGVLRVRIDSLSVGHMFPSGAAQDRRFWLEVRAWDVNGNPVFERGVVPDGVDPEEVTTDPSLNCVPPTNPLVATTCASFYDRTYKSDGSHAHFFWEVASYKSHLIRPAVTRDENSPSYDHSTTVEYPVGALRNQIDRIEAKLWIRPLPFAMLRDLEASGDLDPSIKSQVKTLQVGPTSIWTKATAGTGLAMNTGCNPQ
jgi:hypothetical protein